MDLLTRIEASLEFMNDGGPIGDRVDFVNLREVLEGSREALLKLDGYEALKVNHAAMVKRLRKDLADAESRLDALDLALKEIYQLDYRAQQVGQRASIDMIMAVATAALEKHGAVLEAAVERCEPNPDYVPTIGPAYTPKT